MTQKNIAPSLICMDLCNLEQEIRFLEQLGCRMLHVDVIGFGSTAPYYVESGKAYDLRILSKNGMFEIYVNGLYLQTFNNAHTPEQSSTRSSDLVPYRKEGTRGYPIFRFINSSCEVNE